MGKRRALDCWSDAVSRSVDKKYKTDYRVAKDHNETGRGRKYYDEMDAVLSHRSASQPPVILDASAGGLAVEPSECCGSSSEEDNGKTSFYKQTGFTLL